MSDFGSADIRAMEAIAAKVSYRPATIADAGAMALTYIRADAAFEGNLLPESLADDNSFTQSWYRQKLSLRETWGYVAEEDDRVVGILLGWPSTKQSNLVSDPYGEYIAELATDPEKWGCGIGSTLLDFASITARLVLHRKHISLWVREDNIRAQNLYLRKGYKRQGIDPVESSYGRMLLFDLVL